MDAMDKKETYLPSIRIAADIKARLKELATIDNRTLTDYIRVTLTALANHDASGQKKFMKGNFLSDKPAATQ